MELSQEQLVTLLLECNWDDVNISLNFGQETDGDGFQKQKGNKAGGKDEKITKPKVIQILSSQHLQERFSINFQKLQYASLRAWLPSQQEFDEFENQLIGKRMNIKLKIQDPKAVSYTHLTLPTIYSV